MVERTDTVDLQALSLSFGEAAELAVPVRLGRFEIGGQSYAAAPDPAAATLDVSRTASGFALRLRIATKLEGPCMRCLAPAAQELAIDAREVEQPDASDEELHSPYVEGERLNLAGWARDAVLLEVPSQLLCRPDCAGLCAVCGASLNDSDPAEHRHREGGDPRWAKLRELS